MAIGSMKDLEKYKYYAYLEGWLSIVLNTLLFILKYWAGIVTGSVAIIADAWHTLSDSISSAVVIAGAKVSTKPADKKHPFGHGRFELIASMIIGMFLVIIAFNFFMESVKELQGHEAISFGLPAIIAMVVSVVFKEGLARFAVFAGKRTGSKSLKADAWHHRSDAISSVIILIGIFLGDYYWWIDGILGILVSLFIAYAAYEILKDTISPLLGEKPDDKMVVRIKEIAEKKVDHNIFLHDIKIHEYGHHTELICHLSLPPDMSLEQAHNIATKIEDAIEDELDIYATIHMEPIKRRLKRD